MSENVKIPLPRSLQEIAGAMLFASETPLTAGELRAAIKAVEPEEGENAEVMDVYHTCTAREVDEALKGLGKALEVAGCGFELVCSAGAYRIQTVPSCGRYVRALLKLDRPSRLGRASLETLAIIAYRQPLTKSEMEEIRGVDVTANVKTLMDLQLIRLVGKSELPGHPFLYGTTPLFLEHFGLSSLEQLNELDPTLQRSNPRQKAASYKRPETKKTELEVAAEQEAAQKDETEESPGAKPKQAPAVDNVQVELALESEEESVGVTETDAASGASDDPASRSDDFFIDDTPDEFDEEDDDDDDDEKEDGETDEEDHDETSEN